MTIVCSSLDLACTTWALSTHTARWKSVGETRSLQYAIMMLKWVNKHYCEIKLQNTHIQRWNFSMWAHTNILSFSSRMNRLNDSDVWSVMKCEVSNAKLGDWNSDTKRKGLNKITRLLSMIYNIDRLCCKSFRRISDRLLINRSMVNHWQ